MSDYLQTKKYFFILCSIIRSTWYLYQKYSYYSESINWTVFCDIELETYVENTSISTKMILSPEELL